MPLLLALTLLLLIPTQSSAELNPLLQAQKDKQKEGVIKHVLRPDTIVLQDGQRIRMAGVESVERPPNKEVIRNHYGFVVEEDDPTLTLEERAFDFSRSLMEDKEVLIEFDTVKVDEDGETVAYLFLKSDDTFLNAAILKQGYARLKIRFPNIKHKDKLREAYREARQEQRGIHSEY